MDSVFRQEKSSGCRLHRLNLDPFAVHPDDDSGPTEFLIAAGKNQLGLATREAMTTEADVAPFAIKAALHQFCFTEAILENDLVKRVNVAAFKFVADAHDFLRFENAGGERITPAAGQVGDDGSGFVGHD